MQDGMHAAKFMPCFDGPYHIILTNELPHTFPVFHMSELLPFKENDDVLFPQRALLPPDPVTIDGQQEFFIDKIIDEWRWGKMAQYLVRWQGEGPEGNKWLPKRELEDCEALENWEARKQSENQQPDKREQKSKLKITIPPLCSR